MDSTAQFKHFVDIAWRRKWWVIVPAALATGVGLVLVGLTPAVYRATTTVLVTRRALPEGIARSSVTLRIEERMRSLELQIRSRSYLEQIARSFDLVAEDATDAEIGEACARLREHVTSELDQRDFSWFRISVDDVDPKRAAGIANGLAGLFIEGHSRARASQAAGTLEATENWERRYRLELSESDRRFSEFKEQNVHELPDQQPVNLEFLTAAQSRGAQLDIDIQARSARLAALVAGRQVRRADVVGAALPAAASGGDPDRLAAMKRELAGLLVNYTYEHPLVKRKRSQIDELVLSLPPASVTGTSSNPAATAAIDAISVQIATVENELVGLRRERARASAAAETYSARIANAQLLQPRWQELTRDTEQAKHQFDIAIAQKEQARQAQQLLGSKMGEQLQIQDLAHPPAVPFKPVIAQGLLAGLGVGLLIGLGAAGVREFVDQTVRGEDEFTAAFPDVPVYGVIPSLDAKVSPRSRAFAPARGGVPRIA